MSTLHHNTILILVEQVTPRIKYVFQHVFGNLLGITPVFTQQRDEYTQSSLPKINYTKNPTIGEIHIHPVALLYQKDIDSKCLPKVFDFKGKSIIFKSSVPDSLGFDIFAAIFYVLSRYEEYLTDQYDQHGRFQPQNSIFYPSKLVFEPIVDIWVEMLKNKISEQYPQLSFKIHQYNYLPTIDVDMPYAYRYKKLPFTLAGLAKHMMNTDWNGLKKRFEVLMHAEQDPYDTYEFINGVLEKYSIRPIYFYLCRGKRPYDPIASYRLKALKEIVHRNISFAHSGLHNSYHTLEHPELIKKELSLLESIVDTSIKRSRFHYIRFRVPTSYQHLHCAGINEDYSMGFASMNGFRAGTSHPFLFYDLMQESETSLRIIPFQAMDATYIHYLKLSPDEALLDLKQIRDKVRRYGGTLTVIWHNNTFEPSPWGMQWRKVFEAILT